MKNHKWYQKWWIWVIIALFLLFFIFGVPLIINICYIPNSGYITVWDGKDVLSYYGDVLTFIGTTVLGIIVYLQTQKHHLENKQRIMVDNSHNFPSLSFENESFSIINQEYALEDEKVANQIAQDYGGTQTKYIVMVNPDNAISNKHYAQINVKRIQKSLCRSLLKEKSRCLKARTS